MPPTLTPSLNSSTATRRSGSDPHILAFRLSNASPHGYFRCKCVVGDSVTGQLPAFTHSASVGNLLPAQRAYATASYQLTPTTGRFRSPARYRPFLQNRGPGCPV